MPANLSPTATVITSPADGRGPSGQIYHGGLNGVMGAIYGNTGALTQDQWAQQQQNQQNATWNQVMGMLGGGTASAGYGQQLAWPTNMSNAYQTGVANGTIKPNINNVWWNPQTNQIETAPRGGTPGFGSNGFGAGVPGYGGGAGGGGYLGGGQSNGTNAGGFEVNRALHGDFTNSLSDMLKNPGLKQKTIEGMINKGTDEIAESESQAGLDLTERAAAMGGMEGGGIQKGMRELRSDYAGKRAGLARDIRTDAEKDRLNRIEAGLGIAGSYLGRVEDRQAADARWQAENAREDRNQMIQMLMNKPSSGPGGQSFAFSQFGGGAANSGMQFGGGGLNPSGANGQGWMSGVPNPTMSQYGSISGFGSSGAGNADPYNSANHGTDWTNYYQKLANEAYGLDLPSSPQMRSYKPSDPDTGAPGTKSQFSIPSGTGYSSVGSSAWLRRK